MDNPNFKFIKEHSAYFYEKCSQVDLLIAMKLYEKAIASSRKIIECIVNPDDDIKLLEFLKQNKEKFSKRTYDYLHKIRICGNKAVHPNKYEWKKECADSIAEKMHHVVIVELYKKRYHQEGFIDEYVPVDEDSEWFLDKRFDAKLIEKVLKSAYEDYVDVAIEEQVTENINELREELINQNKQFIQEYFEKNDIADEDEIVLDEKQIEASHFWNEDKNNLIIKAGPGSGKTTVLIERVRFLINEKGVDPKTILLITFTEKAANELKERLCGIKDIKQSIIDQIHVSTIHGFCRAVLKKYSFSGLEIIDDDGNEKKVMFIKKYRNRLGFDDKYGFVPNKELSIAAKKFDELDSFMVNPDKLIGEIEKELNSSPRKEDRYKKYIDENTIDSKFPVDTIKKKFIPRWQKHKFLTIINAYKEYKILIKEKGVFDFNRLQSETRDFLKENRDKVKFTNILVDEFQDTDNIQMEIFELLLKNSNSVTYVGDPDQSIFSWRGSNPEFFDEISKRDDFNLVILNKNYRSPKNIVDFNEFYMSKQRGSTINFKVKEESPGDLFYIKNNDFMEEVTSIVDVIKYLRDDERLNSFSDIAIISNSVVYKTELFNELDNNGIPYAIKGVEDIKNSTEIKGILILIWYLTKSMDAETISLKSFCDDEINNEMFNLQESTLDILDSYEDANKFSTLSKFELQEIGIHENDLDFFNNLNELKNKIKTDEDFTILDAYYKLFKITNYIESKYEKLSSEDETSIKNKELLNLALISHKIKSYMDINEDNDIDGFFEYLLENYENFSSPINDIKEENKVHILTSHKAKGLEFPIVIVSSLKDKDFPKSFINTSSYDIPFKMLYSDKYGDVEGDFELSKLEKEFLLDEQKRVLYVSLTRAQNCLILSTKGPSEIVDELSEFDEIKELNSDNLDEIKYFAKNDYKPKKDLVSLSFTSMQNYEKCRHMYNLAYNYKFISPQNKAMVIGSIAHNCLDAINSKTIDNEISDEEVKKIKEIAFKSNPNLEDNETFEDVMVEVEDYYYDYIKNKRWKILKSEYPFTIYKEKNNLKYSIVGQIDLIIQEDEDDDLKISLVDYKTSINMDKGHDYQKQLHIYGMAVQENPIFEDKDIEHLIIYSLIDDEEPRKDNFNINIKNKLEEEIYKTAKYISHYKFSKTNRQSSCMYCSFKDLCNR